MPEDQDPTVDIGRDQRQDRADREPGQPARKVPKQVGKYFIKSLVATGGMGSVYKAVQDQPRRTVALKLMKTGLQSRSALRRFEYESQVLARLRHPCIAEVFEAGTHETPDGGVPYFAMEYIPNARRITDYAREKSLSTPERLKLFLDVCEAVHHGHTKGVIHRDLKPDNILVDSHGRVKLIDFGVARATDSDMVAATLQTEIGQLVGTVQYMSPEQVEADPDDLDIRSDVYSLGVVLYELLCQRLPYDVGQTNVYDVTRIIREQEAIGLSTVDASLKGDVETIVLKTLEKDRGRRYQSAENLASDIRRYLNTEPITARPPSVAYQLQTFARRNKSLVAGVSAVFLALLIGFISSTLLWIDAVDARNTARKRQAEAETARQNESAQRALAEQAQESALTEAERARKQAAAAEAVSEFLLEDVISAADPETQPNRDITLRQVIDEASARIGDQFADTPLIEATIMVRLGQIYRNLGERITAQQMLQRAYELRRESLGESHLATLEAMEHLALATFRKDQKAAWKMLQDVLEARKRILGESHADTLGTKSLLLIYENVGQYLQGKTNPAVWLKSEEKALELLAESRRELGEDHKITLRLQAQLGWIYGQQGREVELLETSEKALESRRRTLGEKHPMTIDVQQRLADAYRDHGRYDEAEILYRQVLSLQREVLGESHPSTVDTLEEFADCYALQQRLKDAVPLLVEAVEANWRAGRVDSKPESKLGVTYAWMSDVESYTTLCQQVLARHKRTDDLLVAYFSAMTFLLSPHQDHSATLPIAVSVVERAEILNEEQPDRGMSQHIAGALGLAAYRTTKFRDAVRYLDIARESEDPAVKALALAHLAMTKIRMGDREEVVPLLEQSAAVIETLDSSDNTWQSILACRLALREARELVASQTLDQ